MEANFGEINKVFLNLLVNAAQAGARHIRLAPTTGANSVTMRLSDNGNGIPPEVIPQMFESFLPPKAQEVAV
jgi:two-component system, OmpR family, sensor kinase